MSEILFTVLIFVLFIVIVSAVYSNVLLVKKYTVKAKTNQNCKRIVFLADIFSNPRMYQVNAVLERVEKLSPDVIIVAGELPPKSKLDVDNIISGLMEAAPTYIAFSNSERDSLSDGEIKIYNDYSILTVSEKSEAEDTLKAFSELDNVKILLCDKPSLFSSQIYDKNIDIVLSSQGGGLMLRIPFYGLIYSSTEGFLPKYPARHYKVHGCEFVITTGVGKSFLPLRLNNFREIVCVDVE